MTHAARRSGRKALVAFLTAGYPDVPTFQDTLAAASDAGCDVIEIGVPFSDPIADGPVIQRASAGALAGGMSLTKALELAGTASEKTASAMVIMSYLNPILSFGTARFPAAAAGAGISGVILPDVPVEESGELRAGFAGAGIDYIDLLAPTSSDERIGAIAAEAAGFLYLVSTTGVTGKEGDLSADLPDFIDRVREQTDTPAYVGFGISTPEQASAVCAHADGVIIGSQLIRLMEQDGGDGAAKRVGAFLKKVRTAIDNP